MKQILSILLSAVMALGMGMPGWAEDAAKPAVAPAAAPAAPASAPQAMSGTLTNLVGAVEVQKLGTKQWIVATEGMVIGSGDKISAGIDGAAKLQFENSVTDIDPLTQFAVGRSMESDKEFYTEMYLQVGRIVSDVNKDSGKKNKFTVTSPTAVAGIRGTILECAFTPGVGGENKILEGAGFVAPVQVDKLPLAVQAILNVPPPPEALQKAAAAAEKAGAPANVVAQIAAGVAPTTEARQMLAQIATSGGASKEAAAAIAGGFMGFSAVAENLQIPAGGFAAAGGPEGPAGPAGPAGEGPAGPGAPMMGPAAGAPPTAGEVAQGLAQMGITATPEQAAALAQAAAGAEGPVSPEQMAAAMAEAGIQASPEQMQAMMAMEGPGGMMGPMGGMEGPMMGGPMGPMGGMEGPAGMEMMNMGMEAMMGMMEGGGFDFGPMMMGEGATPGMEGKDGRMDPMMMMMAGMAGMAGMEGMGGPMGPMPGMEGMAGPMGPMMGPMPGMEGMGPMPGMEGMMGPMPGMEGMMGPMPGMEGMGPMGGEFGGPMMEFMGPVFELGMGDFMAFDPGFTSGDFAAYAGEFFGPAGFDPSLGFFGDPTGFFDPTIGFYDPATGTIIDPNIAPTGSGLDQDGDQMDDNWEYGHGFNPNDPNDANLDFDGDGYTNLQEFRGFSDPNNQASIPSSDNSGGGSGQADSDGDGIPDSWESSFGLNPNNSADAATDLDGDGFTNLQEYQSATLPNNNTSYPSGGGGGNAAPDADADVLPDVWENANGLSISTSNAMGDQDGDGYSNQDELRLGTNPNSFTPASQWGPIVDGLAEPNHVEHGPAYNANYPTSFTTVYSFSEGPYKGFMQSRATGGDANLQNNDVWVGALVSIYPNGHKSYYSPDMASNYIGSYIGGGEFPVQSSDVSGGYINASWINGPGSVTDVDGDGHTNMAAFQNTVFWDSNDNDFGTPGPQSGGALDHNTGSWAGNPNPYHH